MTTIIPGDCRVELDKLHAGSVYTCVTSPPYFGLRDYGVEGQIGLEDTVGAYVEELVNVFRGVRRVLRKDGTLWLNLGDTYAASGRGGGGGSFQDGDQGTKVSAKNCRRAPVRENRENGDFNGAAVEAGAIGLGWVKPPAGLKKKDIIGIPWRVAFALQADGWYLREDIIWHKPNCMPESVTDRCTRAHEYVFHFSKAEKYYHDAVAIMEPSTGGAHPRGDGVNPKAKQEGRNSRMQQDRAPSHPKARKNRQNESYSAAMRGLVDERNKRSVWSIPTKAYSGAHFATFPPALARPCILAGCPVGGTVLDPFGGSGTTGEVAEMEGRNSILIELNPESCDLIRERTAQHGLFT